MTVDFYGNGQIVDWDLELAAMTLALLSLRRMWRESERTQTPENHAENVNSGFIPLLMLAESFRDCVQEQAEEPSSRIIEDPYNA